MTRLRRREFLLGGLAASAGLGGVLYAPGAGARFGALDPRTSPWGANPIRRPVRKILEIFLYGGLSPWETFFVNPARANPAACATSCPQPAGTGGEQQWGTFRCQMEALATADMRRPANTPMTKLFASPTVGGVTHNIHLGPPTWPLWDDDIFNHLQVLVTTHDLTPHEAAIPYAMTGVRLGRPNQAGTGAAVARNAAVNTPASYVVLPKFGFGTDNLLAATSTGTIGPAFKPLLLEVGCPQAGTGLGPDLAVLNRNPAAAEDNLAAQDALLRFYKRQYGERLTWPNQDAITRSAAFADYDATTTQFLDNLAAIRASLAPPGGYNAAETQLLASQFTSTCDNPLNDGRCGGNVTEDATRQALNFGGFLLTLPETRYVCVIDAGQQDENGAGYDTHLNNAQATYRSLTSTLQVLANMLNPQHSSPYKIDANTMVVITTEFGRTPGREGGSGNGRGHYPFAYTNVIIPPRDNGPNVFLPPPKRLVGMIDEGGRKVVPGGSSIDAITPTDLRAAMLLALGVDPLVKATGTEVGSLFGVGDMSDSIRDSGASGDGEIMVRRNLVKEVLGYETF